MKILYWIIFAGIISGIPALLVKEYTHSHKWWLFAIVILVYVALIYSYIQIFTKYPVGTYYTILKIISIITVFLVSIFIFKEKFKPIYILGLAFAVIAIILLSQ